MATPLTFTPEQLSKARKQGFKRKKPKKPKASSSLIIMEKYIDRYNEYVKAMKEKAAAFDKKELDKKKKEVLKKKIAKL